MNKQEPPIEDDNPFYDSSDDEDGWDIDDEDFEDYFDDSDDDWDERTGTCANCGAFTYDHEGDLCEYCWDAPEGSR